MDMVMNARSPADLEHVYALTVTLLQYRADPNVHIATTEPMICHSQSSVFLKKSSHQVLYYYVQVTRHETEILTSVQLSSQNDPGTRKILFEFIWHFSFLFFFFNFWGGELEWSITLWLATKFPN